MTEPHVRINIAKASRHMSVSGGGTLHSRYEHFCAVIVRGTPERAVDVYRTLVERFPAPAWEVTAHNYTGIMYDCTHFMMTEMIKAPSKRRTYRTP